MHSLTKVPISFGFGKQAAMSGTDFVKKDLSKTLISRSMGGSKGSADIDISGRGVYFGFKVGEGECSEKRSSRNRSSLVSM